MVVHVVGDDPVREEVVAALADVDVSVREASAKELADARLAVVADVAGSERFRLADATAREGETPWIAVEVGGVGGRPMSSVDVSVAGFSADTGCYNCLKARVASTRDNYVTTANPRGERASVRVAGAIAGRECVRILSDDDETVLGSVVELPYVRRRFFPVPVCRCHPQGRDRDLAFEDGDALDLDAAVDAAELAIDDRVGLVTSIGEVESFPAPYYMATTADTRPYSEGEAAKQAAGVDPDWNAAFVKAIGESLERYCAGVYREHDFIESTATDLERVVEPTAFAGPDDAPAYDPSESASWVEGRDLATGDVVYLPADAVHFPQPGGGLVPQITTGLGLGSSTTDAVISGLTEVIERDATMLAWYSTFDPLGLELDDERFEALTRRLAGDGLSVTPLLVTQDVDVPVVAVAVHREGGDDEWPAFAVGSAADLDVTAAARSALAEAVQNWMELRSIGRDDAVDAGAWIGEYAALPEAARSFVDVDRTVDASAVGPDPVPEGVDAVETLIDRVAAVGLSTYAARLTTRDVAEIGFEAVRVLVPGSQPLFTDEPYFAERAESVPRELGFVPALDREPHPYP